MTDYKQLCVELLSELENAIRVIHAEDGTQHISGAYPVINKVKNTLVEPEPEGPTDEEILQLSVDCDVTYSLAEGEFCTPWQDGYNMRKEVVSFARAVLARWGSPAPQPPAPWQWLSEARPREGQQCEWVLLAPWGTNSGSGEWVVIDSDVNSGAHFNSSLGRIVVTGFKCEKGLAVTDPAITAWRSIA